MGKLTTQAVRDATKPGRYGDGGGLYLVVSRSGSASWIVRVQKDGRRRDIGIGSAKTVMLATARVKAARIVSQFKGSRAGSSATRRARSIEESTEKGDEWRQKIDAAIADLITRDGFQSVTIRRIAAEMKCSTTMITHYFSNKREMIASAYDRFAENYDVRFKKILENDPDDLVGYLVSLNPFDDPAIAQWRGYVAVWEKSLHDPLIAALLRRWNDLGVERVENALKARNPNIADPNRLAKRLISMVFGISISGLLDRESWTFESFRQTISEEVELIFARL